MASDERRGALSHTWTPRTGPFAKGDQCSVMLARFPCPYPEEDHRPGPPENVDVFGHIRTEGDD